MNVINSENSLFLVIDIQEKLVKMLENDDVAKNGIKLMKAANILNIPTIITEQYPKGLGETINEIKEAISSAKYVEKTSFSAYDGVKQYLNKKQVILFGIESHICVLQTAFDLINKGYEVFLVKEAVGSRNINDKKTAINRMQIAGVQIVSVEMVIFELLKTSMHKDFKLVQSIIK